MFLSFSSFFWLFFQLLHGFCWLSKPLLGFLEVASIMSEFSCYCQSYDRNSVQCLMHVIDLHTLCCCPLKVSELACDCQFCSKLLISFGFSFRVLVFRAGVTLFSHLLICCQIWNPYNLVIGLSLNSIQVDLDLKCEVVRSYWRCCILGSVAHEKTWHSNCLGMTGVANFRHAIPLQPIQNVTVPWSFYVQEQDS